MVRAFIAFKLPENVIACLENLQHALSRYGVNIRWVPPENIHLTLKFLGNISMEKCPGIESAVQLTAQAFKPLKLSVKGIGVFPGIKNARIIWAGLSGEIEVLMNLRQNLETQLVRLGLKKENRPFRAHLTLGRIKKRVDPARLLGAIRICCEYEPVDFNADHMVFYKSDLTSNGALYTALYSEDLVTP